MKISKKLILWCAFLVILFVQVPHLAWVFADMSAFPDGWARLTHGTLFAISVDASVLLFALRGREFYTSIFMGASFIVTIQYYRSFIDFQKDALLAWSTIFIALVGVLAVYFLSREVKAVHLEQASEATVDEEQRIKKMLQDKEESVRSEIQSEQGAISFTDDDIEIIRLKKQDMTYDQIIEQFKKEGKPISKDKISRAVKKFKDIYS